MFSWREYWLDCNLFARAMIALGAEKFDVITILGTNSVSREVCEKKLFVRL
jgi:long-subunit acyl-CoA synthetase (AMP-forming)